MQFITRISRLWRHLLHRQQEEAELTEELRGYERLLIEEHLRAGMTEAAAQHSARVAIGGVEFVKESVRAERSGAWIDGLTQDLRYGVRSLLRAPAFTTTAIIALALGIGASTAIFSVVNGVLLRPLPFRAPDELVTVLHGGSDPVSPANFADWRAQNKSFSSMAVAEFWSPNIAGDDGSERVTALRLSASMFPMLGVSPVLGRVFGEETEMAGRDHEVVLGYDIWQERFAGDSTVVGHTLLLNGVAYTVIGVMPRHFALSWHWAKGAKFWAPLALRDRGPGRGDNSLRAFARLKPGASVADAQRDISAIAARLEIAFPRTNANVVVTPLMEQATAGLERPLILLLIAVSFLLVAACANVAHMMLARGSSRQREMAVRIAIGATGGKLARQLLCESLLLSSAGGILGMLIATAGTRAIIALGGNTIPRGETVQFDVRVLLVTIAVSVFTGLLFGMAPARNAARTELVSSLKDGGRAAHGGAAHAGFRHALVASQFAIALTLLVGAGLMMRTLAAMQAIDPGFNPHGVISAEISVSGTPSANAGNRVLFYERLAERLQAIPRVSAVSAINHLPLGGDVWGLPIKLDGVATLPNAERLSAAYRVVMPSYFNTMNIPLLRGRDVNARDRLGSEPVALVNQRFAERYWPGEEAIGKRFAVNINANTSARWMTVVGVAKNSVRSSWTESPEPEMYLPLLQEQSYLESPAEHFSFMTFVARTDGDAAVLSSAIRRAVADLDRGVSVSALRTMDAVVANQSSGQRFYLVLLSVFAGAALMLAAVGIYGVMNHAVSRRRHEMAVRIALGASRREVMGLIVGRGMGVVLSGAIMGVLAAMGLTRLMATIIYGVQATDPMTFAGVTVFLLLVALMACWIPARRATQIDPLAALRGE